MTVNPPLATCDVAIAGASLAGLALARALALALGSELRLTILERRPADRLTGADDPRAYAISAGSQRMLDALGVWPVLADHAQPVSVIDITDSALEHALRPVLLSYDNSIDDGAPATWIVEAARLRTALLTSVQDAPGVTIRAGKEARDFTVDDTGVAVHLADGAQVRCGLLVAADGARSPLREASGIKLVRWEHPQIGIVVTVAHERPHAGHAVQHFLPAGPFAILPLRGNRSCITWTEEAERGKAILALNDAPFLGEAEQRFGYRLGALSLAGPRAGWPLSFHMARALVRPRFALLGESVRSVHPIAGQGLNLGFRDAAALAQCVADAMRLGLEPGDGTVLERYERWRRFDSVQSAAGFEALNALFSNRSDLVRAARDVGLGLLNRAPGLKQALVVEAAGLSGEVPRLFKGQMA